MSRGKAHYKRKAVPKTPTRGKSGKAGRSIRQASARLANRAEDREDASTRKKFRGVSAGAAVSRDDS